MPLNLLGSGGDPYALDESNHLIGVCVPLSTSQFVVPPGGAVQLGGSADDTSGAGAGCGWLFKHWRPRPVLLGFRTIEFAVLFVGRNFILGKRDQQQRMPMQLIYDKFLEFILYLQGTDWPSCH